MYLTPEEHLQTTCLLLGSNPTGLAPGRMQRSHRDHSAGQGLTGVPHAPSLPLTYNSFNVVHCSLLAFPALADGAWISSLDRKSTFIKKQVSGDGSAPPTGVAHKLVPGIAAKVLTLASDCFMPPGSFPNTKGISTSPFQLDVPTRFLQVSQICSLIHQQRSLALWEALS